MRAIEKLLAPEYTFHYTDHASRGALQATPNAPRGRWIEKAFEQLTNGPLQSSIVDARVHGQMGITITHYKWQGAWNSMAFQYEGYITDTWIRRGGMSRGEVAATVRAAGLTPRTDHPDWLFLYNFQNQEIGALRFQNDRVVGALQTWVSLDRSGVRTANGFIGAVAEALGKSTSGSCTVTVESHATPTMTSRSVKLQCGKKTVVISSSRSEADESTIVIESLGDVWAPPNSR